MPFLAQPVFLTGASASAGALPPAPTAARAALDLIFIDGFRGETVIGIHDQELHLKQPLIIDVCVGVAHAQACSTDAIGDTIDYGAVRERLAALMDNHGVKLLEALGERIMAMLIGDFGAAWARVKIVKPNKFNDVSAVGIQLERWASEQTGASSHLQRHAQVLRWIGSGMVPAAEG